jgi:predicted acyltransferase
MPTTYAVSPTEGTFPQLTDAAAKRTSLPGERLQSVDILRGFDMFWISGGEHLVHALAVATGWLWASALARQLSHSTWEGFTFYDLIQPLFLFITGLTLPLAILRRLDRGAAPQEVVRRFFVRMLWLIVLGHIDKKGPISFDLANLRYTSVLGRIGVAGFVAGLIVLRFRRPRDQLLWVIGILVGYWAFLTFVPVPGRGAPSYAQGVNIVDYLDQHVMPGKLRSGNHDANGWFSTPPVIATVLLGALAGTWLLSLRRVAIKVGGLAAAGLALVLLGLLWNRTFPIIKHIWTSSYVLYAAGWSCLLLGLFYGVVDGLKWRRWGFPLVLIGMNPLVIYLLLSTGLLNFKYIADFFFGFAYLHAPKTWGPVWQHTATIALELAFLYWLYRRKFFWRV